MAPKSDWKPYNDVPLKDGEVLVPMRVTLQAARDYGANLKNLRTWVTGGARYQVMFIPVKKEQEKEQMCLFNNDINQFKQEVFGTGRTVSFDGLLDQGESAGFAQSAEDAFLLDSLDDLLKYVSDKDPTIGTVLRLGWQGYNRKQIVEALPVKKSRAYDVLKATEQLLKS